MTTSSPPLPSPHTGAFVGIASLALFQQYQDSLFSSEDKLYYVGSFAAQAVLIFAAPGVPLAQPWNCAVGNLVSAFTGVCVRLAIIGKDKPEEGHDLQWLACALSVALSIFLMVRVFPSHVWHC